ncbi:PREDICTED: ceramide phosphoethanolamine synthase [Habropoda laboriosa]|uniref:ceramide phosphoethanolamine synthase n=1 Tax=Habropoda laboriosa TaxID=597456 RepID=UPI00083D6D5B|nr:PREDICTED: ceramide phosphoethanolamine synthase [Habropoda laboriosa]
MFGTTTLVSRSFLAILILLILYFLGMDLLLYSRIQNYDIRPTSNGTQYVSIIPCDFNPLCTVTVKGLMLDHPNYFLLSPLAAIMDNLLHISTSWTWVTPNGISYFHVLIAVIARKCVSSDSLSHRRLGVILFIARTWLDDLDGHVARKRANINGERSDVGSTGYIVDGICDALGCVALLIGLYQFLARNSTRRGGYDKLPQLPVSSVLEPGNITLKTSNAALRNILLMTVHLFLTSAAWNRYISLYQDLLETEYRTPSISREHLYARQTTIFRSLSFWIIVLSWKFINFHSVMDYLLLAIFFDRMREYIRLVKWSSYIIVLLLVYVTEFHFLRAYTYVQDVPSFIDEEISSSDVFTQG